MRGRALIPPAGTISLSAGARYEDRLRPPSALEALKGATATTRARCGSGFIAQRCASVQQCMPAVALPQSKSLRLKRNGEPYRVHRHEAVRHVTETTTAGVSSSGRL